jgi:hypothetical protein
MLFTRIPDRRKPAGEGTNRREEREMTRGVLFYAMMAIAVCCSSCGQADNIRSTIAAMPMSAQKLYLYITENESTSEHVLSATPDEQTGQMQYYLYGEGDERVLEWVADPGGQTLGEEFTYDLLMASSGNTQIAVQFILKKSGEESTLASDSFSVKTDKYERYKSTVKASPITVAAGDRILLRLKAKGSNFGIVCGGRESSVSIFSPTEPPVKTTEERTKALTWAAENFFHKEDADVLTSDLFTNFKDALDDAILSDTDGSWTIGWGLTHSKKPYSVKWTNKEFSFAELTIEEAQKMEVKEMEVTFKR